MDDEAKIVINGVELTKAQSMTVRVALESFAGDLAQNGLGDDEHGQIMRDGYLDAIREIRKSLYKRNR